MRIFILSDPNSIHTKRWVASLASKGIDIFLFGLSKENTGFYEKHNNVQVFDVEFIKQLKNRTKNGSFEKLKYLKVLKSLRKCIKEFKPDILHAHYASSYGLLGTLAGFHPYIVSCWGSDVYDFPKISFIHKAILKFNLSRANKILSTSHVMAKEASKYTNKVIEITPFGVDTELFKKINTYNNGADTIVIGTVKALSAKYGIDFLIKAFKIVVDNNPTKNLVLKIIGEGEDENKLKKLASELNISSKVDFIGKVDNSLLPDYYNSFLVAVSLSVLNSESFGVVAVEAMSCECPVVTSDADGFTEVVADGETGFIVPKKDEHSAAVAIQKFIDNPSIREIMGKNGRNRVEQLYNWDKNVDKMISIYQQMIA